MTRWTAPAEPPESAARAWTRCPVLPESCPSVARARFGAKYRRGPSQCFRWSWPFRICTPDGIRTPRYRLESPFEDQLARVENQRTRRSASTATPSRCARSPPWAARSRRSSAPKRRSRQADATPARARNPDRLPDPPALGGNRRRLASDPRDLRRVAAPPSATMSIEVDPSDRRHQRRDGTPCRSHRRRGGRVLVLRGAPWLQHRRSRPRHRRPSGRMRDRLVKVQNANTAAPAGSPPFTGWCLSRAGASTRRTSAWPR